MRKMLAGLTVLLWIAVACSSSSTTSSLGAGGSASAGQTAQQCAANATYVSNGSLTVGTDNPAYPPYFQGGAPKGSPWKINDPNTGKGFESAVAYEIAKRLGFTTDQVNWVVVPFAQSYAPGTKSFDLDLNQISYKPTRAQAVDFSESYYDVNQALVAVKGTPIDAVAALNAGQVDGIVVDLPTALYMADPYVQQVKNSVVVGQFPNPAGSTPEYFGAVLPKDSSLTPCVDLALQEMKADGTLQNITKTWLSKKTNVGTVPVFSS